MLIIGTCSSIATLAFASAPGIRSVVPIPNGLSVFERIVRIALRVSSADSGPVASIPTPPALDTAETSVGSEIQDIPGRTRGYLHPNSEVMRVRIAGAAIVFVCMSVL
mmetsp:Transcript_28368/g.40546  ORF Transcript_28368/g.40546 Transcript_28368/m.40546 type:complete len:108 (-) Transcript_28368:17-340(-)